MDVTADILGTGLWTLSRHQPITLGTVLTPGKDMFHPGGSPSFLHFLKFGCTGSSLWPTGSLIFLVACKIFRCCVWDLVSWPRVKLAFPVLKGRFLTTGPPGKSLVISSIETFHELTKRFDIIIAFVYSHKCELLFTKTKSWLHFF